MVARVRPTRIDIALGVLNGAGALLYLWLAAHTWARPEERAAHIQPAIMGDIFIWMISALPVLVLFFVVDLVWGLAALMSMKPRN